MCNTVLLTQTFHVVIQIISISVSSAISALKFRIITILAKFDIYTVRGVDRWSSPFSISEIFPIIKRFSSRDAFGESLA